MRLSANSIHGNLDTSHPLTLNFPANVFQWTGGTIGNYYEEIVTNTGTINLSGAGGVSINAQFTNSGTMIQTGAGSFTGLGLDSFNNATGALFDLRSDAGILQNSTTYAFDVANAGTLQKSAGTGTSSVSATFTNTGTVAVLTGTLDFSGPQTGVNGGTLPSGTWTVANGAALTFSNYPNGITVNQATVVLNGANAQFPAINPLTDNQGTFSLLAQRQFTTAGALNNEGDLSLDAGTTLQVAGAFTASGENATLAITVGGAATSGATSPGILQVNGAATVAGNLSVAFSATAALPGLSDTLAIVSAAAPIAGSFANATSGARLNTADGKGSFLVTYGAGTATPNVVTLSQFVATGSSVPPNQPVVTLTSVQPNAYANQGISATLQLARTGDLSQELVVNLQFRGSAVDGTDYDLLKTTKKIPAGKASKSVKIVPIDASFYPGGKKTVKITLLPGTGYAVGSETAAKVKIFYDR